jgi:hypothetical protein
MTIIRELYTFTCFFCCPGVLWLLQGLVLTEGLTMQDKTQLSLNTALVVLGSFLGFKDEDFHSLFVLMQV